MNNYHSSKSLNGGREEDREGKIRCAHLLIKHEGSRRPASWREAKIIRTKDEALEILQEHEKRIKNGEAKLGDIASTESDCSSYRKRGDL